MLSIWSAIFSATGEPSLRSSSMTRSNPLFLLCVTERIARLNTGNFSPSREEIPVRNVKISIARLSASFVRFIITYGSRSPLFLSSLVRLTILISCAMSGIVSCQLPRSDFGSTMTAFPPNSTA